MSVKQDSEKAVHGKVAVRVIARIVCILLIVSGICGLVLLEQ